MGERVREEWRRRERRIPSKKESRGGIFRRRVDQKMSLTGVWVLGIEIYRCVHDSRVIFEIGVGIGVAFSFSWDRCFSIKSFGGFFFWEEWVVFVRELRFSSLERVQVLFLFDSVEAFFSFSETSVLLVLRGLRLFSLESCDFFPLRALCFLFNEFLEKDFGTDQM